VQPLRLIDQNHVLFIHGAGQGAYEEDRLLADVAQEMMGEETTTGR
jgi:hypothetical protein